MATPYNDVFDFFLMKVEDYSFLELTEEELAQDLERYMRKAVVKFTECKQDLSDQDKLNKQFNEDLTDFELEIIASLMVVEYLQPKIVSVELMKQRLPDKEYKTYSQAKQLDAMIKLRSEMSLEATQLIGKYSFSDGLNEWM